MNTRHALRTQNGGRQVSKGTHKIKGGINDQHLEWYLKILSKLIKPFERILKYLE